MIVRAAWVLPISAPPICDGFVEFEKPRILRAGPWSEIAAHSPACVPDFHFPLGVLLPGFVNPHTHLELTGYAGMIPQSPFWPWIGRLARLRKERDTAERIDIAVIAGVRECLQGGITCVGDISRRNQTWNILKKLPIRKVCFAELLSFADFPPRSVAELQQAVESIDEDELLTAGVSPHAPYTVPLDQVRGAVALAGRLGRPWTLHLGETREEIAFLSGDEAALPDPLGSFAARAGIRSPRLSLSEYLRRAASDTPKGSLAHMNYAEADTIAVLAELGVGVLYCPGAHRFFGHPPHPFRAMIDAGTCLALGTDSAASNTCLSMLSEMRIAQAAEPRLTADALLHAATLEGARALGLENQIGSLEAGKFADLAVFELPAETTDPARSLLDQGSKATVIWIGGHLDFPNARS